ncbi:laccase-17 [Dorcoceras hygrometricum]|uniref:Laccase-17 n=1 Tax=Dorcoceras hygrometricum TaxID=472368 RepID=A0A2Z7B0L4_9LAMI|nr:laccase-17 [Dorcoceras hygrometricum]
MYHIFLTCFQSVLVLLWLRAVQGAWIWVMVVLGWSRGGHWMEEKVARHFGRAMHHARRKDWCDAGCLVFMFQPSLVAHVSIHGWVQGDRPDPGVVLPVALWPRVARGETADEFIPNGVGNRYFNHVDLYEVALPKILFLCSTHLDQFPCENHESSTCVTLNGSGIQLAVGPQPLRLRNHNFGLAHRIMVKRLATSPHDPLGITDSACKNQLVMVSVQYSPFNTYIPIRSTTIGKSRVARDPIAMHTSWRSNSDIASVTRASMTFRVVRTNQYNQDLGLIHSTNGNHLESPDEGSSIDHQVTIHLHAQNITMFPTNETWYFASQMLVSSSGGLILILTVQ